METKPKTATTIKVPPGPLGYVYARACPSEGIELLALLSARSGDADVAVAPLVVGLTVESGFEANVAVVVGSRTTGLGVPRCP